MKKKKHQSNVQKYIFVDGKKGVDFPSLKRGWENLPISGRLTIVIIARPGHFCSGIHGVYEAQKQVKTVFTSYWPDSFG